MADKQKYNDALNEIEKIISEMESGEPDVDDMLRNVKRASELIRFCKERLRMIDEQVGELLNNEI